MSSLKFIDRLLFGLGHLNLIPVGVAFADAAHNSTLSRNISRVRKCLITKSRPALTITIGKWFAWQNSMSLSKLGLNLVTPSTYPNIWELETRTLAPCRRPHSSREISPLTS